MTGMMPEKAMTQPRRVEVFISLRMRLTLSIGSGIDATAAVPVLSAMS